MNPAFASLLASTMRKLEVLVLREQLRIFFLLFSDASLFYPPIMTRGPISRTRRFPEKLILISQQLTSRLSPLRSSSQPIWHTQSTQITRINTKQTTDPR